MIERTEMHSVDCDLVLIHLDQHQHVERLAIADGAAAVTFLSAPHLVLKRVANDRRLIGPNADVQRDVIAWIQGSSSLYIDLAPVGRYKFRRQRKKTEPMNECNISCLYH